MNERTPIEPMAQEQYDTYDEEGPVELGVYTSHIWRTDPKHLSFLLARYKFCSKMLIGKSCVLEVGCGDGFGLSVVLQTVDTIHGVDIDPMVIENAMFVNQEQKKISSFSVVDITEKPMNNQFDAVYSLDVLEHIPNNKEETFIKNICKSLKDDGICIIGTPNISASAHASSGSAGSHINLQSGESLRTLLSIYFENVLIFSMNDEVIHTGFTPMSHYLFGIGTGIKK